MVVNLKSRELFLKIMNFESSPRTLNWEFGYWGGALNRWYQEGLPQVKGLPSKPKYGQSIHGQALAVGSSYGSTPIKDYDISEYFSFDNGFELAPYNYWMSPSFEKKTIFEDDKYIELYDFDGMRKKILKDDSSMPLFLEWPVKTRKDWEKIKEERFNLNSINKRFLVEKKEFIKKSKNIDSPFAVLDPPAGFFGSLRFLVGEENLLLLYYDDPELVNDILDHLCDLWIAMSEELTSETEFDLASFWEDMAGRQGSLISPEMFRIFMAPRYRKIINFLKTKGINLFLVDTDGRIDELVPLFLEAGINIMYPFEQQAGNDLIELRKNYPELRMIGGFDKNILSKGIKEIDKELEKMSYLISNGGYIPTADHLIPPDVPWVNFKYYRTKLKEIIYSCKVLEKNK